MFPLVPCLFTVSWLSNGPVTEALSYAYGRVESAISKLHAEEEGVCQESSCLLSYLYQKNNVEGVHSRQPGWGVNDHDAWGLKLDDWQGPAFDALSTSQLFLPTDLSKPSQAEEDLLLRDLKIETVGPLLGNGTYGHVFEAEVVDIGRAAIKLLNEEKLTEEGDLVQSYADFWVEAGLHWRCRHPNIVQCYGIGSVPVPQLSSQSGRQAMVMELLTPHHNLTNLLRSSQSGLPGHTRVSCALGVARALEHIHSLGIVHFDVKPDNVIVDARGICKLTDFGLAIDAQGQSLELFARGSVAYMAPELHDRSTVVDNKVDVFSFGVFTWELLTGREPHEELTYDQIADGVLDRGLRPKLTVGDVSPADHPWVSLMEACWRQARQERPSFSTIVFELERLRSCIDQQHISH